MELCKKEQCTGCLACYNACKHKAIKINSDKEGFNYPHIISDLCVECGLCSSSCPILNNQQIHESTPRHTYATWSKQKDIIDNSSSGGAFTILAEEILNYGGVVFGATLDIEKKCVKHIFINDKNDLWKLQGSKYVQSHIGNSYSECSKFLRQGYKVLFTGTPCQIAGLYTYLRKNDDNLITLDIICHGVPSPLVFYKYLIMLENKENSNIKTFKFRDKHWSWNRFNIKCEFNNGHTYYGIWEKDTFIRGFLRELYLRPSCHNCGFAKSERISDITLGDFWGYRERSSEKLNFDRGISLVLINTTKGNEIFNKVREQNICYEREYNDAVKNQQALRSCFPPSPLRENFWQDFNKMNFGDLMSKYCFPEKLPFTKKIKYKFGHLRLYRILLFIIKTVNHKRNKV